MNTEVPSEVQIFIDDTKKYVRYAVDESKQKKVIFEYEPHST